MTRLAMFIYLLTSMALAADVDPSLCRDIDARTRPLVPVALQPWYRFQHAVQACPAYSKAHKFLWWIITINLNFEPPDADNDPIFHPFYPDGISRHCTPDPLIVDNSGRELGQISDAYPTGGFGHTDLFFSEWVNDFPRHITVKVFNAGVECDYLAPALQWNVKKQHYDRIGQSVCDTPPPQKQH